MKAIIAILISLAVFFSLAFYTQNILNNASDELSLQAQRLKQFIVHEEWQHADKELENLKELWGQHKKTWLYIIDHEKVDNVDVCLFRIDEMVKTREKVDILSSIAEFKFHVIDAVDKESLSLANIF